MVDLFKSAISGGHDNRLIHLVERDISSKLFKHVLINSLSNSLLLLVLGVDGILCLLNFSIFKFLEVIVFITFLLLFLGITFANEVKGCIVLLLGAAAVLGTYHATLVHFSADCVLVLLVNLFKLLIHDLVIGRLPIG